ncbi:MAG: hypothetical protein QOH42_2058 [Blastocatellia bacterium]|nr:hypothetical protein [Blastocatellia bacterium]
MLAASNPSGARRFCCEQILSSLASLHASMNPITSFVTNRRVISFVICLVTGIGLAASCLLVSSLAKRPPVVQATTAADSESAQRSRIATGYGTLPLGFETNLGQAPKGVRFISRGHGYSLYLTQANAVLALRSSASSQSTEGGTSPAPTYQVLGMRLVAAERKPHITALEELAGKANYFLGSDSRKWHTNVPLSSKVRYENAYPGIDVIYHGNQGQLEYDFVIAPGSSPQRIEMAFDGAQKIAVDGDGELVLSAGGSQLRQKKPVAYQEVNGERREVSAHYRLKSNKVAFEVGAYDKTQPLIIDPVLIYSTFLGGSSTEQGLGVAVDSQGSAYVTGSTLSIDFPLLSSFQSVKDTAEDAFVVKLNPTGTGLVYSTYLGGNGSDIANAIAVDAQGNAYVTGVTGSGNFPTTPGAFQTSKSGFNDGFVTKLSPAGSSLLYSTYLGGDNNETIYGVAIDATGRAYVVGRSDSTRFNFFPLQRNGSPAYKTTDGAAHWFPSATDLNGSLVNALAIDPGTSSTVYAGTNVGVFKSTDAGNHWNLTGTTRTSTAPGPTSAVVIDPSNSSVIYAGTQGGGVYKSTDGGALYDLKNTGLLTFINALAIDPTNPAILYAGTAVGIFKSTNGADSWVEIKNGISGSSPRVNEIAIDPTNPATVYMGTSRGMFKTTNGGAQWTAINAGALSNPFPPEITALVIDPLNPSTLYASGRTSSEILFKTIDGGATWNGASSGLTFTVAGQSVSPTINTLAIDPVTSATIYAATSVAGIYKSTTGGANWSQSNTGLANATTTAVAVDRNNPATVYTGTNIGNDAFIVRFDPSGSSIEYLLNFGGNENDEARGVALDANNNAYVVGSTSSLNFPAINAFQPTSGGLTDAFVSKVNASGSGFVYSTFLGGGDSDLGRAIAVRSGRAYVVGQTTSKDFPLANAIKSSLADFDADGFVTGFNASGSSVDFSTYLGGENLDQALGVAVDPAGSIFVTGSTSSFLFPVLNATQPDFNGSNDAFVTKLNSAGNALVYSTYLGGIANDVANGIAVDSSGAYVVGNTSSSDFPTANPFQPSRKGTDAFITKIGPAVDVGVTMTDNPDPVNLGNDLTYTIEAKNSGELTATGVLLSDVLPVGANLVSANATLGTCTGSTTITCDLGTLASGSSATVTLIIKPPAVSSISNTATASTNELDPNQANNSATQTTQVVFADLSVLISPASTQVAPGSKVVYIITARNNDGATANSVTLVDNLPAETTFVSCSSSGVCGGSGNNRTITFPSLAVGQAVMAVLVAQVGSAVSDSTIISNTVTVSSAIPDSNSGNNSASATVTTTSAKLKGNGKIAFSSGHIFTVSPDASSPPAPLPNIPDGAIPAWSPDGAKIAYLHNDINVANIDGTGIVKVADNAWGQNGRIAWSPSGTRIAYVGKDGAVYLANSDGSGFVKLPNSPSFANDLDWSPDGTKFLITKDSDLYLMDLDGVVLTKLSNSGSGADGPFTYRRGRWSPDMSKILCERRSNNYFDVMVMNADGSGVSRFLNLGGTSSPAWSPDGAKVAFYYGAEVHDINFDGSGDTKLASGETCCGLGSTDWQPLPGGTPPPPPPPGPTFTISGHVGTVAQLELSGTRSGFFGTDSNGNYTFVNLPAGGTYTIIPKSNLSIFNPTSRTYTNLAANVTDADFSVAGNVNYSVTGRLTEVNGSRIVGAELTLAGGFPSPLKTTTDANGRYAFNNLVFNRTYSLFPTLNSTYSYVPGARVFFFGGSTDNTQVADFKGYKNTPLTISGRVTDGFNPGVGISGADVRISNTGVSTLADANGNFSFPNLTPGSSYTVTVNTSSLLCVPNQIFFTPLISNQSAYFVCYPPRQLRTISGRALDSQGNNMSSMLVTLSGAANSTATTAADGSYAFTNVAEGFNYIVRPYRFGFAFAPSKATILSLNGNSAGNNFTGTGGTSSGTDAVFEFDSAVYTASEGDGSINITVTRAGSAREATVDYAAVDGTASGGHDYTLASGTLHFDAGQTTQTFNVLLVDDPFVENPETVFLTLNSSSGGSLGAQSVSTLTITDNDPVTTSGPHLILDESGPDPNQAAAFDSFLFLRDPFHVQNVANWIDLGPDPNTRVILFAANLQLNQGEPGSDVVVNLVDANDQTFDVPAEDVRPVPILGFTQIRFRLPNTLAAGICTVTIKVNNQVSNAGTIRIVP